MSRHGRTAGERARLFDRPCCMCVLLYGVHDNHPKTFRSSALKCRGLFFSLLFVSFFFGQAAEKNLKKWKKCKWMGESAEKV